MNAPTELQRLRDAAQSDDAGDPIEWPEPEPLATVHDAQPYPVDALPPIIREAVTEAHEYVQAPLPLIAACAHAAVSVSAQHLADVQRDERLRGPVGIYLLTVAESGERKTSVDALFFEGIRAHERAEAERLKDDEVQFRAAELAWTAKRDGLVAAIRKASQDRKPTAALERDMAELEAAAPIRPRAARLRYGDATAEALTHALRHAWPSGALVSAEAGAVFGGHAMGRDAILRSLATLNMLWDGADQHVDRRKEGGSFILRDARLTIGLQVQPEPLAEFMARSGVLARGSGFFARFCVTVPTSTQGSRLYREPPADMPALGAFTHRSRMLLAEGFEVDDAGGISPPPRALPMDPQAQAAWRGFHDLIEQQLADGGELRDLRDAASKAADNVARLAALYHLFEQRDGPIRADGIEAAARIVAWHLTESRRLFGETALPRGELDAARLDRWIVRRCRERQVDRLPRRDLQRFGPIRDRERLAAAVVTLSAAHRTRDGMEGRSRWVLLNPALLRSEVAEAS